MTADPGQLRRSHAGTPASTPKITDVSPTAVETQQPAVGPDRGFPTASLSARGVDVEFDLGLGQLVRLEWHQDGRTLAPFHRAAWADDSNPGIGADDAPHLARLSGDFFCAPFGTSDVELSPMHGWTANSRWHLEGTASSGGATTARFVLQRRVVGARVVKELTVRDDHPFLYQRHVFEGGRGALPVASHAMVSLPHGGQLSWSPKRWAESPPVPLEVDPARGRSVLAYPARSAELPRFPTAQGGSVDLSSYPFAGGHEDFVMLVEACVDPGLAWTAVRRPEQDVVLTLKNRALLPQTMLWFSNGGRSYAPWNGRHRGVLGVEDALSYLASGHFTSSSANPLDQDGVPTALALDENGSVEVRHVIGAATHPGNERVDTVRAAPGVLNLTFRDGTRLQLPYDDQFLLPT